MKLDPAKKWHASELNLCPDLIKQMNLPRKVTPFDSTLREGEETPGVVMTLEDKVQIARKLEELGVRELEIGYPGLLESHAEILRTLKQEGFSFKIGALIRMWAPDFKREIDRAVDLGADILELCSGASDHQLNIRNFTRGRLIDTLLEATEYAKPS